jgi:hypothetical protein
LPEVRGKIVAGIRAIFNTQGMEFTEKQKSRRDETDKLATSKYDLRLLAKLHTFSLRRHA